MWRVGGVSPAGSHVVTHLGGRGDGVVPVGDEKPLYLTGVAPGDMVHIGAAGEVLDVTAGPNRITPVCRHFGGFGTGGPARNCGGCSLQHVAPPAYASWLGERVLAALRQHGLAPAMLMPAHVSPPGSRRRATLRAVRAGSAVRLGFNAQGSHDLFDLEHCPVLSPVLMALIPGLRGALRGLLTPGALAHAQMTLTQTGIDLQLNLSGLKVSDREALGMMEACAALAETADLARLTVEADVPVDLGLTRRVPQLSFGGIAVDLPPGGFTQATEGGEQALVDAVTAAVGPARRIADLFCGIGTFALSLKGATSMLAVDAAGKATAALDAACRRAGRPLTVVHRDLYRRPLTGEELSGLDAVVLDPPRAGAAGQCEALASSPVPRIASVSCNPNTFARDSAILVAGGYRLERLWPVGQFLWSNHVEVVGEFVRP